MFLLLYDRHVCVALGVSIQPAYIQSSINLGDTGRVFTTTIVSLNIPEGVLFTDFVKRLKNDRCFHELN